MRDTLVLRTRILCAFFIVLAVLLIVRLYFVQIVHGDAYERDATSQYVESGAEETDRGTIYFTTKDGTLVAAATQQTGWRIAIRPADVAHTQQTYDTINAITPIDEERYFSSVAKLDDPYEEVAFRIDDDAAKAIRTADLPGVILVQDQWRTYPARNLAAQVLGFVGYVGDRKQGVYGLERKWQDTLATDASGLYVNPFAEIFSNVGAIFARDPSSLTGSIITTIEPTVQGKLEGVLDAVVATYSPRTVGGIVMDPRTGEIVGMGVRPSFDPNTYNTASNVSVYANPLVEGRYELGSIMKPLTVAAGIDSGAITTRTTYNDTGCITRSTKKICNFDGRARGVVDMQEVLSQSLNVGAAFVAEQTGQATFAEYMKAYGLGERTDIDLPNEVMGDLSPIERGSGPDINFAAASYGQGVSVSPIAMARALSALASGGTIPSPHVVKGMRFESGVTRILDPVEPVRVLKPETAETVSRMLAEVVDTALLDGKYKKDHYSIAAKTGTAQIARQGGGYYDDRYLHSFFGYFPAYEPRFIIFLFAVEPHGVQYASASLAAPFGEMTDFLINYYNIPPDR